ncbi:MAG: DUF2207 domain-containing protein [Acidimicrobiia bacterium]|nr:DUF2207 domain-containing protein [Acidimicrobiia bacterium]MBP8180523.1 DUF2207 domain-containing protein [Acidimicrobiia bacterium]
MAILRILTTIHCHDRANRIDGRFANPRRTPRRPHLIRAVVCWLALIAAGAMPSLFSPQTVGAQTSESIRSMDVDITLSVSGAMEVTETITYDFGTNQRRGIIRFIPWRVQDEGDPSQDRVWQFSNVSVSSPSGAPADLYEYTDQGNQVFRIGNPDTYISGQHRYVISYVVDYNILDKGTDQLLTWDVTGDLWEVPIETASATITLPIAPTSIACYAGPIKSTSPCSSSSSELNVARFAQTTPIDPGNAFTVEARIPSGTVANVGPLFDSHSAELTGTGEPPDYLIGLTDPTPLASAGAVALGAAGVAGVFIAGWAKGRDEVTWTDGHAALPTDAPTRRRKLFERPQVVVEFSPPDDISPAHAGVLIDERADARDLTATIIDLAQRGYLKIIELPKPRFFGRQDWELKLINTNFTGLAKHERSLLEVLFPGSMVSVKLSKAGADRPTQMVKLRDDLSKDMERMGWFRGDPNKVRGIYLGVGSALGISGLVGVILGIANGSRWTLLPIAGVVAGLCCMIISPRMPARTAKGSALYARLLGFQDFIENADKEYAQYAEREQILTKHFAEYLPYAISFGVVDRWAKAFSTLTDADFQDANPWYVGIGPWDRIAFANSMASMTDRASSQMASVSTPRSSSGGGGFSGGGFSGGGGGGGGGGSW